MRLTTWFSGMFCPGIFRAKKAVVSLGIKPVSDATAGPRTFTAAELLSGIIVRNCAGAARTDVLPSAQALVAALPNVAPNDTLSCEVVNGSATGAESITFTAGAGGNWDVNQTAASRVIPGLTSGTLLIQFTVVKPAGSEAYVAYL